MQYIDSSALLKRYIDESDSDGAERLLGADPDWVTAAHTEVEVRRTLALRLGHQQAALQAARAAFEFDWRRMLVVHLDAITCRLAADLAETTQARSLDALHLAAAQRAGAPALRFVTYDIRLAHVARSLGWSVVGA